MTKNFNYYVYVKEERKRGYGKFVRPKSTSQLRSGQEYVHL